MVKAAIASALLAIALGARAAPAPYLIESEFEPARAYVGAEVILRLRLLRAPGVPYGVLRPPQLGDAAEVSPLGYVRNYPAERAGVAYEARERAWLVVPRRAGRLVLPGPELDGPLRRAKEYARGARGAPRVLEVLAPRAAPGEAWLPVRRVTLEESWSRDPGTLAAGEAVVRTLVVRAEGITGNRLPALQMLPQPGLGAHHETSSFGSDYLDAGMAGRRERRVVLIPQVEGELELPALHLAWWDVAADAPRVATLPARAIRVGPAAAAAPMPAAPEVLSPHETMRVFAAGVFAICVLVLWVTLRRQPLREARRQLRAACAAGDAAAARSALADWWMAAARKQPMPLMRRMGDAWDADARAQLVALEAVLYGARAWDGKAFWRAVRPWLKKLPAPRAARAPALPPLFKLQERRFAAKQ